MALSPLLSDPWAGQQQTLHGNGLDEGEEEEAAWIIIISAAVRAHVDRAQQEAAAQAAGASSVGRGRKPPRLQVAERLVYMDLHERSDSEFKRNYRMSKEDFRALFALVLPYLPVRAEHRCYYTYEEIFMCILRLLASGDTFDSCARFVDLRGKSIVEHYVDSVLRAIVLAVAGTKGSGPETDCSISFPSTPADLATEKARWTAGRDPQDHRYAGLQGCFAAGDGTLIPVMIKNDASFRIEAHRARKGDGVPFYNCLAIAGARRNFMYFNVGGEGCGHDSQLLQASRVLDSLPPESYILFDSGAALTRGQVLTPYKGRHLAYHLKEMTLDGSRLSQEQLFNLRHSIKRSSSIECAFGLLKGKWRILKRGIHMTRPRADLLILACASLHNYLVVRCGHGRQDLADAADGYAAESAAPAAMTAEAAVAAIMSSSAVAWRDAISGFMHQQYIAHCDARDYAESLLDDNLIHSILHTDDFSDSFATAVDLFGSHS